MSFMIRFVFFILLWLFLNFLYRLYVLSDFINLFTNVLFDIFNIFYFISILPNFLI